MQTNLSSSYLYVMPQDKLEPDDYYKTEEGYIVFTEKYLLKRGYCCQNGCRHCPYGFNKKTGRLEKKNSNGDTDSKR